MSWEILLLFGFAYVVAFGHGIYYARCNPENGEDERKATLQRIGLIIEQLKLEFGGVEAIFNTVCLIDAVLDDDLRLINLISAELQKHKYGVDVSMTLTEFELRKMLLGFMLDCNSIGKTMAADNLIKMIRERISNAPS